LPQRIYVNFVSYIWWLIGELFQVISALQGISESDDSCLIEDSSSENSYLPNDESVMPTTSSQGNLGKIHQDGLEKS
jgi:hypothetical protein